MRIGIDASNIRAGGGVTHLQELLTAAEPARYGISKIIVWGGDNLDALPDRPWLVKRREPMLTGNVLRHIIWQRFILRRLARESCDLLFVPGGNFFGGFAPTVVMAQNLLPFDARSRALFGLSLTRLRLHLLNRGQSATFHRSDGIIFMTEATLDAIVASVGPLKASKAVIPHGMADVFRCEPRRQLPLEAYDSVRPFRWLYVSIINHYKHQWHVVEAVARLRRQGYPVVLDLVGPAYPPALRRLKRSMEQYDPHGEFINYWGAEPHGEISLRYQSADGFIFASSCETISIILMEAMASGLPIACSKVPPLPEVLGPAGVYFDPENPDELASRLEGLMQDAPTRAQLARDAYDRALEFTWKRCVAETFSFLAAMPRNNGDTRAKPAVVTGNDNNAINFHESIACIWAGKYSKPSFSLRASAILSLLEAPKLAEQRWLDAGCGAGVLSMILAEFGAQVIGVDGSPAMIAQASGLAGETRSQMDNLPIFENISTIERLDGFDDGTFDGVLCSSVLEYLDNPEGCLKELWRVLKPGGSLLISVPNSMSAMRLTQKALFGVSSALFSSGIPAYMKHSRNDYTGKGFSSLLDKVGFETVRRAVYGPRLLERFLGSKLGASLNLYYCKKY